MRTIVVSIVGFLLGLLVGFLVLTYSPQSLLTIKSVFDKSQTVSKPSQKQIIGFLPYWLVANAPNSYADYITTLTYFGLTVGTDGHIQFFANPGEEEPGWHTLKSKKLQDMLHTARKNGQTLSLLVFSGDADAIDDLIASPAAHAKNLVEDVAPIMRKYGFTDLNLDIESTKLASPSAQAKFTQFVQTVNNQIDQKKLGTLTVEITGDDLIRQKVSNPKDLGQIADYIVIMAYDFHYQGSAVTGAVAPIGGGGTSAEFDTKIVLNQAYRYIPRDKIILGVPSYGYSWESLNNTPNSATLPGSGIVMSSKKTEEFLASCATCSAAFDQDAQESYVIYKDDAGTYHQLFFPNKASTQKKVELIIKNNIAGIAVWALGYEDRAMLEPFKMYKTQIVDITRL